VLEEERAGLAQQLLGRFPLLGQRSVAERRPDLTRRLTGRDRPARGRLEEVCDLVDELASQPAEIWPPAARALLARAAGRPCGRVYARTNVLSVESAILVRHGESEFSARGSVSGDPQVACPLTAVGREQARRLGRLLAGEEIDVCVTSEFPRTVETAELALAERDVPRVVFPELNDPRAGAFEGGEFAEYLTWARAPSTGSGDRPPGGGESRRALVARYARGYRKVLRRPEHTVLVVGHSLPTSYVLEALDGRGPSRVIPLIAYAEPHRVSAADLERAVGRLEDWSRAPTW
jgi:broad specificity phosphatase PhoE